MILPQLLFPCKDSSRLENNAVVFVFLLENEAEKDKDEVWRKNGNNLKRAEDSQPCRLAAFKPFVGHALLFLRFGKCSSFVILRREVFMTKGGESSSLP